MSADIYSKSKRLGALLKKNQLKIVTAESCTGGGLAFNITSVSGSSEYLDRGFVTYTNESKMQLLDVDAKILEKFGAVSEQTAGQMAQGALKNSGADIALSITGTAGPLGGTVEKPVGLVCFGLALRNKPVATQRQFFTPDRAHIRSLSIAFALQWAIDTILSKSK